MNVTFPDLRASRNCSSTEASKLCIICISQTARALAGEPKVVEGRGFDHYNRLPAPDKTVKSPKTKIQNLLPKL